MPLDARTDVSVHGVVSSMLEAVGGFTVFGFTGATSVAKRHAAIRTFQEQGQQRTGGAKVFVCTIKVRLRLAIID